MNKSRFPWEIIPALLLGLALGVLYAWVLSPLQVVDSAPEALRADFKDQYRAVIAAAYAANSDLTRAQSRLALLGDTDSYAALSAQAQRTLSGGDSLQSFQLAQLASALQGLASATQASTPTHSAAQTFTPFATANSSLPSNTPAPSVIETPFPFYTATLRPTRTPIPPPGAPFELLEQETICDESLPEGLLQVITLTANRRHIPGIELILLWAGGEEHFFTGFKPELGNGYADAIMLPNVLYNLRAADGGVLVTGLTPPTCQRVSGESYFGGIKITLYRP